MQHRHLSLWGDMDAPIWNLLKHHNMEHQGNINKNKHNITQRDCWLELKYIDTFLKI